MDLFKRPWRIHNPENDTVRTFAEMNAGITAKDDARRKLCGPFTYEWWYFSGTFTNGYSFVAILWTRNLGNPFKRECTKQFSIYEPGGGLIKHLEFPHRDRMNTSYESCDVSIDECFMRGGPDSYEVHIEVDGDWVDLKFESIVPGWKKGSSEFYFPLPKYNSMGWMVAQPAAKVTGRMRAGGREMDVEGTGYHDHNWGEGPMMNLIDNWHWGHVLHDNVVIAWADIMLSKIFDYEHVGAFFLNIDGKFVYEAMELDVSYDDWTKDPEHRHPYPRALCVRFGSEADGTFGEFTMNLKRIAETHDLIEATGLPVSVQNIVIKYALNPYYFRWLSELGGYVEHDGHRIELGGETIHEQMILVGRNPEALKLGLPVDRRKRGC
ncbi:MAG: hypothetical protein JXA49_06125 [Actinobacteria bacterium]|nr:hypothetical protein [Actinomycetota bacterium]